MQTVETRQSIVNQTSRDQTLELKVSTRPENFHLTLIFAQATNYRNMLFSTYKYERHPAYTGRISILISEPSCDQKEQEIAFLELADPVGAEVKLCRTHNYSVYYISEKTKECPELTIEVEGQFD